VERSARASKNGQVAVGGDIIEAVDGKAIASSEDLANEIGAHKPGQTITIKLRRATGKGAYKQMSVQVTLGSRPNSIPNPNTPGG